MIQIKGINRKSNRHDTPTKTDFMVTILYPKR